MNGANSQAILTSLSEILVFSLNGVSLQIQNVSNLKSERGKLDHHWVILMNMCYLIYYLQALVETENSPVMVIRMDLYVDMIS